MSVPVSSVQSLQVQLWTIDDFARRLKCSTRHLRRLVDAGRAPAPIRLGALLRFNSSIAEKWIADGCPDLRRGGKQR
jgi:excisionase family DNA binding protein